MIFYHHCYKNHDDGVNHKYPHDRQPMMVFFFVNKIEILNGILASLILLLSTVVDYCTTAAGGMDDQDYLRFILEKCTPV